MAPHALVADRALALAGAQVLRDVARRRTEKRYGHEDQSPAARRRGKARQLWRAYLECLTAQDRARGTMARPRWGGESERYAAERQLARLEAAQEDLEGQLDAIEAAIAQDSPSTGAAQ